MCYVLLSFLRPGELHMGPGKYIKSQKTQMGLSPLAWGAPTFTCLCFEQSVENVTKKKNLLGELHMGPRYTLQHCNRSASQPDSFFKKHCDMTVFLKRIHSISHVSKGLKPTMIFTINPAPLERQFSLFFFQYFQS
jgi:hypothetical protein